MICLGYLMQFAGKRGQGLPVHDAELQPRAIRLLRHEHPLRPCLPGRVPEVRGKAQDLWEDPDPTPSDSLEGGRDGAYGGGNPQLVGMDYLPVEDHAQA